MQLVQQVIVITGASSGIGLATAKAAYDAGAKVVLVARNEEAWSRLSPCPCIRSTAQASMQSKP